MFKYIFAKVERTFKCTHTVFSVKINRNEEWLTNRIAEFIIIKYCQCAIEVPCKIHKYWPFLSKEIFLILYIIPILHNCDRRLVVWGGDAQQVREQKSEIIWFARFFHLKALLKEFHVSISWRCPSPPMQTS